jgi:indolepyruvate ferredoxin oxidoreductase beta subunit
MADEDIPRVAQLKIRPDREQAVREEVRASSNQPMELSEFFHPRLEEVAALLPVKWGEVLLRSGLARRCSAALLGPRTLRTDRLLMQLALRFLAGLRRFRRGTLGYAHEWEMINRWYQCVLSVAGTERALVVAQSGGLVKGYGETRHRTSTRLMSILDCIEQNADITAQSIRTLLRLAMEPDSEEAFLTAVASHSAST